MGVQIQRNLHMDGSEVKQARILVNQKTRSLIDHEGFGEGLKLKETREDLNQSLWDIFQGLGYE